MIALDFDSTLAATSEVAFDLMEGDSHDYTYDDIEDWAWGIREFGKHRFLSACWHAWTLRPLQVRPLEQGLPRTIETLRNKHEVHILTAHPDHPGITEGKKEWLDHHGIEVDSFNRVDMGVSKADFASQYEAIIDDKPTLPAEVNEVAPDTDVYLRDHRYNRDADGEYVPVESVHEAVDNILGRESE